MPAETELALSLAEYLLWAVLLVTSLGVIFSRNLVKSLVYLAIFSLTASGLYLSMHAPDVAITEAAIGSAISTLFFLVTFNIVGREETGQRRYIIPTTCLMLLGFVLLVMSVFDMPLYGDAYSPASQHVADYYIQNSFGETGVQNIVTSVLASYRGFDTLGEVYVVLTAMLAVVLIMSTRENKVV